MLVRSGWLIMVGFFAFYCDTDAHCFFLYFVVIFFVVIFFVLMCFLFWLADYG